MVLGLAAVFATGEATGCAVVTGFAHSPEFMNLNLDDTGYIMALYLTIFGRMPDGAGVDAWQAVLDNGCTRRRPL